MHPLKDSDWLYLFLAFSISALASAGSLFFSEVMLFMPCVLCWYQRIAMYPLCVLLLMALLRKETYILPYAFALAGIGGMISLYHNLLHWGIIPEDMSPCVQGVPCSTVYINYLGFITIPFLSLCSFLAIIGVLAALRSRLR